MTIEYCAVHGAMYTRSEFVDVKGCGKCVTDREAEWAADRTVINRGTGRPLKGAALKCRRDDIRFRFVQQIYDKLAKQSPELAEGGYRFSTHAAIQQ